MCAAWRKRNERTNASKSGRRSSPGAARLASSGRSRTSGRGTNPKDRGRGVDLACGRPRARHVRRSRGAGLVRGLVGQGRQGVSDYDTDILTWSERQAALLRRIAAGERINDEVDWPNVVEEIESVGRS